MSSASSCKNSVPCVRRLSANSSKQVHSRNSQKKTPTKPAKATVVNPLEVYARQELEAWIANQPQRDAARKAWEAEIEERKRKAELRAARAASRKEQKRVMMNDRMTKLEAEYAKQKAENDGLKPLKLGGCAICVRLEEEKFFMDYHPPRENGFITCRICNRDKQPVLRHHPGAPIGDVFPCFMCSEPIGWVYYCPDCSGRKYY